MKPALIPWPRWALAAWEPSREADVSGLPAHTVDWFERISCASRTGGRFIITHVSKLNSDGGPHAGDNRRERNRL